MNHQQNLRTYSSGKVVAHYAFQKDLQKPEETIFSLLKASLSTMKMLDIGIGGGRTTTHFAPLVNEYTGIDYAGDMIAFCKKTYSDLNENISFITLDIRSLDTFPDHAFDFILISFNSIDYINEEERAAAFKEIKRILSPSGIFCFSTHNIRSLDQLYKFRFRKNVFEMIKNIFNRFKVHKINKNIKSLMQQKNAIVNDGSFNFGLNTFYIQPEVQVEQLGLAGFKDIRLFELERGAEITDKNILKDNKDFYLYYLCTAG